MFRYWKLESKSQNNLWLFLNLLTYILTMKSNTENLSKALLTATFGLFLVSCNNDSSNTGAGQVVENNVSITTNDAPSNAEAPSNAIAPSNGIASSPLSNVAPADLNLLVKFDEAVSGLTLENVRAGASNLTINSVNPIVTETVTEPDSEVTVLATEWAVNATPINPENFSNGETIVLSLIIQADITRTASGKGNVASPVFMQNFTVPDTTPDATVSISTPESDTYSSTISIYLSVTFSRMLKDFDASAITVTGADVRLSPLRQFGDDYISDLTIDPDGSNDTITISIMPRFNQWEASNTITIAYEPPPSSSPSADPYESAVFTNLSGEPITDYDATNTSIDLVITFNSAIYAGPRPTSDQAGFTDGVVDGMMITYTITPETGTTGDIIITFSSAIFNAATNAPIDFTLTIPPR